MVALAAGQRLRPAEYILDTVSDNISDMPRIPDLMIDGVAFLYPTVEAARANDRVGGSGFVVGVPAPNASEVLGVNAMVPYLISNRHVVYNQGACVPRFNKRDGGTTVLDLDPNEWVVHPDGADLAATCVFGRVNSADERMTMAALGNIMPKEMAGDADIGPGDEVFMIGRFINHQGREIIEPAVRFGNISMKPQPIFNTAMNADELSWAVEMRSRSGFSGSPVIVYRQPGAALADIPEGHQSGWAIIGVNWGHIVDENNENTWLNGVVPSWKIAELLSAPKLRAAFEAAESRIENRSRDGAAVPSAAVAQAPEPPATDDNPRHREDFNSLLGGAVRGSQSDKKT